MPISANLINMNCSSGVPTSSNLEAHHRILIHVRKLALLFCAALIFVALKNLDPSHVPGVQQATLPFKITMLSAGEPDRELAIPVEGVRVKQVGENLPWRRRKESGQ